MRIITDEMTPLKLKECVDFSDVCEGDLFMDEDEELWMKVDTCDAFNMGTRRLVVYSQIADSPKVYLCSGSLEVF